MTSLVSSTAAAAASGEPSLSLEQPTLQEGQWLLLGLLFTLCPDSAVSMSPAWGLLPVSMCWEAAPGGLERGAHKSQAEAFLSPQFVPGFVY